MSQFSIHRLGEQDTTVWSEFVTSHEVSFYHDVRWKKLIEEVFGHQTYYLYAKNAEQQVVGILPLVRMKTLLFGNYLVSLPFFNYAGIIATSVEAQNFLIAEAEKLKQELGCSHVELRATDKQNCDLPVREDKVTMLLQLPKTADELWSDIGAKRRAQVKRPIREGVSFKVGGAELIDDFYSVFSINMRDLGTPVYAKKLFESIFKYFPKEAKIAIVELNGEAVATGFLLDNNGKVEIPWASTLRKVNRIGVNMFLYWNILKDSIESGAEQFDFGRSSKDSGTLKFKKQWGAQQVPLYWYYMLPENEPVPVMNHSNPKYQIAINLWQKLPLKITQLVGPHIVRGLP
ncbi:FemAB family XrtA/PEP-CTERM system-associated protein [Aliikangiella sp. IMCC44653]